jgi:small conductance mechanosensitive channel
MTLLGIGVVHTFYRQPDFAPLGYVLLRQSLVTIRKQVKALIPFVIGFFIAVLGGVRDWSGKAMEQNLNNVVTFLQENVVVYGVKLIAAGTIFFVGRFGAKAARAAVSKVLNRGKVDPTLIGFLGNVTYSAVLVIVFVLALNQLGIETTSLVAVLGAAGLAVGLALQGSLSNFASGILLILFRPIRIGDYIEAGGAVGSVREIEILTTKLTSPDNKLIIVPNSKIMGDKIVNHTALGTRRIDLELTVPPDKDVFELREKVRALVNQDKRVLSEPAPEIQLVGSSTADAKIIVLPWVKTQDYGEASSSLREKLLDTWSQAGNSK